MAFREDSFTWLKEHNVPLALGSAVVVVALFALQGKYDNPDANAVIGAFTNVIFTSLSAAASVIATFVSITAPNNKWGEAVDFRMNMGLGALIGAVASIYQLYKAFNP